MFQLTGNLIDGRSAYSWLVQNSNEVSSEISICSAFLRSSIIKDLSLRFRVNSSVRVMVRWQLGDLLAGASDLESYELCRALGWKFYVCLNFHGKVFHLPPHGILVGSANATESGFGLLSHSNSEACTIVAESNSNIHFVDHFFQNAFEMNDELFQNMKFIFSRSLRDPALQEWPDLILQELNVSINQSTNLFLSECFKTNGAELLSSSNDLSEDAKFDLSLLGLSDHKTNIKSVARHFKKTKIHMLLLNLIQERGGEVYFGNLSSALHDWLIEDPAPHRREVKILVKNLYGWIASLGREATGLYVDRPKHSERIKMI